MGQHISLCVDFWLLGSESTLPGMVSVTTCMAPGGSDGKESACNAGDPGLIPGSERSSEEGNGNLLWYSCLGNPMDGGAWRAKVESDTTE